MAREMLGFTKQTAVGGPVSRICETAIAGYVRVMFGLCPRLFVWVRTVIGGSNVLHKRPVRIIVGDCNCRSLHGVWLDVVSFGAIRHSVPRCGVIQRRVMKFVAVVRHGVLKRGVLGWAAAGNDLVDLLDLVLKAPKTPYSSKECLPFLVLSIST